MGGCFFTERRHLMVKLNIFDINEFLQTVNSCKGEVNLVTQEGNLENINKKYQRQQELVENHKTNKNFSRLSVNIPNVKDYFKVIFFSIANC